MLGFFGVAMNEMNESFSEQDVVRFVGLGRVSAVVNLLIG